MNQKDCFIFCSRNNMIVKIIFTGVLALAIAQENYAEDFWLNKIKEGTEEGLLKIQQTHNKIDNTPWIFDDYVRDRLKSLEWEAHVQRENLNKTITLAVFSGMHRDKQFTSFQCVIKCAKDTENKLIAIHNQIDETWRKMKEKELSNVMHFERTMRGFYLYFKEFSATKLKELNETSNTDARAKIGRGFLDKKYLLISTLKKIEEQLKDSLHRFFENFVNYAFTTEKNLIETQKKGSEAITKCVF